MIPLSWTGFAGSSYLKECKWDPDTRTLTIRFNDNSLRHYEKVPKDTVKALMHASSSGAYFRTYIRDSFESHAGDLTQEV